MLSDVLERVEQRKQIGQAILDELALIERWTAFGRPVVVGAMAYDLVVSPDVDLEICCPELRIEHGFQIVSACALHPQVTKVRFSNELAGRDKALYWQLRYRWADGIEWKIDMWSAPADYDLPRSESLVAPMKSVLTAETRRVILELKERRAADPSLQQCPSIDLYRAVLDDGVEQLRNCKPGWQTTQQER